MYKLSPLFSLGLLLPNAREELLLAIGEGRERPHVVGVPVGGAARGPCDDIPGAARRQAAFIMATHTSTTVTESCCRIYLLFPLFKCISQDSGLVSVDKSAI